MAETLGEKHKHFNRLVKETIHNGMPKIGNIAYNQPDASNLLQIDIACHYRNVEFILNVFKCEDMLYVSRAIKHSTWLVQDPQYTHIINPQYLQTDLFPYMLTEARKKLLLHIRLHLKDQTRNENFFNYFVDIDLNSAMKWFPNCSVAFIISRLEQDINRIPETIFLSLLWVTLEPLRVYIKNNYWKKPMLQKAMFILCRHTEEYFDILDSVETGQIPDFNAKYTKLVMEKCLQRLLNNFERYGDFIDSKTFVKYIKKEDLEDFLKRNTAKKELLSILTKQKSETLLKLKSQDILNELLKCDPNNYQDIQDLLQKFHDSELSNVSKKFTLQFIHGVIRKFKTYRFDKETWVLLNSIYSKIGVYDENKKHLQACLKFIIIYYVLNDKVVPDFILTQLTISETFKSEQKRFNKEEKKKMFTFLYNTSVKRLELCESDNILTCLESVLLLLQAWGEDWQNYPIIVDKIKSLIKSMVDTSSINNLYNRNKIWQKILINESLNINCNEETCINVLKHNPKLLCSNKEAVITLLLKGKNVKRFCTKLRMYWPDSLGKEYKSELMEKLQTQPSKGLLTLLSRDELSDCLMNSLPKNNNNIIQWDKLNQTVWPTFIAKNMYRARPKPSMQLVQSYGKGLYHQDLMASIKSVLHSMPAKDTLEYIQLQQWPEFVQKLCVDQIFTKFNREDRKELILSIWMNTKYSSVRAIIFKVSYKSLVKFNKNAINSNDMNSTVENEWKHLKFLIETLSDNESTIVYNLLSRFEKVPHKVRSEYCITGYMFLKKLPPRCNCQRFMNNIVSKINYNKVLFTLPIDVVAEMVHDTIIPRLWTEKLDYTYMDMVFQYVFLQSSEAKRIEAFEKILHPLLDCVYKNWNIKTHGLLMVRYNIMGFISQVNNSYKDMLAQNNYILLNLLLDNLQKKICIKDNYVIITNLKLAAEYLNTLAECERPSPRDIYKSTTMELSKICVKIFCEDVASYSSGIWRLFFHAWQMMLNGFSIEQNIVNKVNNNILDLSKNLSPELDILLHILVLKQIFYTNYSNKFKFDHIEKKYLWDRIAAHPSKEVKSQCSIMKGMEGISIHYTPFFYSIMRR